MTRLSLGLLSGAVLLQMDTIIAVFFFGAASIVGVLMIESLAKGVIVGFVAGAVGKYCQTVSQATALTGLAGMLVSVGITMSSENPMDMVPGPVVGAMSGFIAARWGK